MLQYLSCLTWNFVAIVLMEPAAAELIKRIQGKALDEQIQGDRH